jgi:PmbA protein
MSGPKSPRDLLDRAETLVRFAGNHGADETEVTITDALEFNVDIRKGKIENLVEAGSRYVGLRIIKDKKTAYATSSDLTEDTLQRLVKNAIRRAEMANPDEFAGLPVPVRNHLDAETLDIYDPEIAELSIEKKIVLAAETEKIALQDKRITNSHGASFESKEIRSVLSNSYGMNKEYKETYCGLSVGVQAGDTDNKVEGFWSCAKRHLNALDPPDEVAKTAVERTVRQLNPRKIATQNAPVIFEPTMTSWLLGFLFACVSGVAVYRKLSFLAEKRGEKIADEKISVYDDGLMPGLLGTRPYDSEGVPAQKSSIIENGTLMNFLCNTYAAKKLGLKSTGNADGPGVGPNNFFLQNGAIPPEEIVRRTDKGLLLIRTIGHGLNPVTGDISRGAFGLWIENGEILYPVSEITISGNLGTLLHQIDAIGNDLDFRSSVAGPTIRVGELTIGGE